MQRLVYSPKAFIFIKRRNGDVADVSRYVTSGTVNRRVNAVSTATFTLRNPDMFFTAKGGSHAAFFPMDPVTIYLQRLKGRPTRVFTGFLDETPYYEMYPGAIEFSASCTLKKLLYTYFDPALTYTTSFLASYGWQPDGQGNITQPMAMQGIETDKDGGMGALLFATLKEIGHWDEKNIKIEALPADLITRMGNMLRTFEEETTAAKQELETLIRRFVGSGDYGQSGSTTDGNVDTTGIDGDVPEVLYQVGKVMNVPIKYMLAAFETGIVESNMTNLDHGDADSKGWRQERVSIYGESATDVNASAKRFFEECKQFDKGDSQTAGQLAADVQRPAAQYRGRYEDVKAQAQALMEKIANRVNSKDTAATDSSTTAHDSNNQAFQTDRTVRAGASSKGAANEGTRLAAIVAEANRLSVLSMNGMRYNNARPPNDTNGYDCSSSCAQLLKTAGYKVTDWPATNTIKQFMKRGEDPTGRLTFWNSDKSNTAGNSVHIFATIMGRDWGTNRSTSPAGGPSWSSHPKDGFEPFHVDGLDDPASVPTNANTSAGAVALPKKSVVYVGDSLSIGTYPHVKAKLGKDVVVFDGKVGRNSTEALSIVQAKVQSGTKVVIFDAGTNDDMSDPNAYKTRLKAVKTAAGTASVIVFSLNRGNVPAAQVDAMNAVVDEFGQEENVTVLDWASKKNLLGSDGTHPAANGYVTRGEMTATAAQPSVPTTDTSNTGTTTTNDQMLSRAKATILAQTFQWADTQEQIEAFALQGNKSLMNDKPLMPFIQQMSESSLRQFMSMPNGDFFAFYPDYFGETWHRPPYWIIDDIEVLEGRVRLSDAALVTHEYAIGSVFPAAGALSNKLFSAGVVSITNAFQSDSVTTQVNKTANDPKSDKATTKLYHAFNRILKQDEAVQFLERYGARPDVQEFPFIRNPFFELFMAYQRFMQAWSRQFLSPFKLTFMPELYPGGKVGFPEHGLQMYIEEVTHIWDYSSGFVTEAELSSPAAMLDAKGQPMNTNLPTNMPTALLEAANDKSGNTGLPSVTVAPDGNGQMRPT